MKDKTYFEIKNNKTVYDPVAIEILLPWMQDILRLSQQGQCLVLEPQTESIGDKIFWTKNTLRQIRP